MQMTISNASSSSTQAVSGAASAKGTEGGKFNLAFVQTMAGTQGKEANAGAGGDAAVAAVAVPASALASLLNGSLSTTDLLSAIEALLQKLDDTDANDLANTTTESNLADALRQLDNLLSVLTGVPLLQQNTILQPDSEADSSSASEVKDPGGAMLAMVANMNASTAGQATTVQAAETAVPDQAQAVIASLEELNALKSGLQEALTDLKALLQAQKGTSSNPEQSALVSKGLAEVEQLINGKGALTATAASTPTAATAPDPANATTLADSVRSLQTMPQSSSHLQRMAHQLLHVGLLNVVQAPEEKGTTLAPSPLQPSDELTDALTQVNTAAMDVQRQLDTIVKPVIVAQPVPVQQFASTIQGLVVKQFNVSGGNGISQAQLTLYPEHLGQVNVNISVHNGTLTAQFVTDTVTAKDMLENQMAQLRSALQSQGLNVEKLVVSQSTVQQNQFQDRQGQQGQQQESAKRNRSQDDSIGEIDFANDMEELTAQQAVDRDLGLGRAIHTIA